MDRAFTAREKVLMIILALIIIGAVYYLFVYAPSSAAVESAQSQLTQVDSELTVQQALATQRESMEEQLEELKSDGASAQTTPKYDNNAKAVAEINKALSGAKTFTLNFQDPEQSEDGTAMRRTCSISFTAKSYAAAKSIIEDLMDGKYSCLVTDFSITSGASNNSDDTSASVNIVYYESL